MVPRHLKGCIELLSTLNICEIFDLTLKMVKREDHLKQGANVSPLESAIAGSFSGAISRYVLGFLVDFLWRKS